MDDASSDDLQGNVPDRAPLAVILIDVISDFEFRDGAQLFEQARKVAPAIARLKQRAVAAGVPCIYANDNYGRWRSDFRAHVAHCSSGVRGAEISRLLAPAARDYFVLKPKHSAFYETCLKTLLEHLGARTLILAGFATDMCVHMSAMDAYLRGHELIVPSDTSAALTDEAHASALASMRTALHARTPALAELDLQHRITLISSS